MQNVYRIVRMKTRVNIDNDKYLMVCPFHLERTASCEVNERTMTYHCHSCGKMGKVDWKPRRK